MATTKRNYSKHPFSQKIVVHIVTLALAITVLVLAVVSKNSLPRVILFSILLGVKLLRMFLSNYDDDKKPSVPKKSGWYVLVILGCALSVSAQCVSIARYAGIPCDPDVKRRAIALDVFIIVLQFIEAGLTIYSIMRNRPIRELLLQGLCPRKSP